MEKVLEELRTVVAYQTECLAEDHKKLLLSSDRLDCGLNSNKDDLVCTLSLYRRWVTTSLSTIYGMPIM